MEEKVLIFIQPTRTFQYKHDSFYFKQIKTVSKDFEDNRKKASELEEEVGI